MSNADDVRRAEVEGHNIAVRTRRASGLRWLFAGLVLLIAIGPLVAWPGRGSPQEYAQTYDRVEAANARGDEAAVARYEGAAQDAAARSLFFYLGGGVQLVGLVAILRGLLKLATAGKVRAVS